MDDYLKEVSEFLKEENTTEIKCAALEVLLGLTGSSEGCLLLLSSKEVLDCLLGLFSYRNKKKPEVFIARDTSLIFLNLSSLSESSSQLTALSTDNCSLICEALVGLEDKKSIIADQCCMILANLSRNSSDVCKLILEEMMKINLSFDKLVRIFCDLKYNEEGGSLHYIGAFLSNMTHLPEVRRTLLDQSSGIIQRLLPFTDYAQSATKRGGVIACLRNCCFHTDSHSWLLSSEVNILPYLLLPLAGPEELKDEEYDELPPDLQYLGSEKQREQDPDIRKMVLEALLQLCATKDGRQFLRDNGTYYILRELHKWEKDPNCIIACENLVDILIKKEEEIGYDDLKKVELSPDIMEKFLKDDIKYLESLEQELPT